MILSWCVIILAAITRLDAACCPSGWTNEAGKCILIEKSLRMTWVQANAYCKSRHPQATLLNPKYKEATKLVYGRMGGRRTTFWVGVTDQDTEGVYRYPSGEQFHNIRWVGGRPTDKTHRENCLEFWAFCYRDKACNDKNHKLPFACSLEHYAPPKRAYYCPSGTTYSINGRCMNRISAKNHERAKKTCHRQGGHLATLASPADLYSIALIAFPDGMDNNAQDSKVWIGLSRGCRTNTWRWDGGTALFNEHLKWRDNGGRDRYGQMTQSRWTSVAVDLKTGLIELADSNTKLLAVCSRGCR